jgi:hypothetical protein
LGVASHLSSEPCHSWNSDIRIKYSQSAANESTEVLVSH